MFLKSDSVTFLALIVFYRAYLDNHNAGITLPKRIYFFFLYSLNFCHVEECFKQKVWG